MHFGPGGMVSSLNGLWSSRPVFATVSSAIPSPSYYPGVYLGPVSLAVVTEPIAWLVT